MRSRFRLGILLALLGASSTALAQTPSPIAQAGVGTKSPAVPHPEPPTRPIPKPAKRPVRKPAAKASGTTAKTPLKSGGGKSGSWIRLNAHLIGTMGESTWVNLAQAVNIRFYQSGKTEFAAVGVGGSSYVSTSDPAEIQALRAYVLSHQTQ